MTRVIKPDNQGPAQLYSVGKANSDFIANYKEGAHKALELDILNSTTGNLIYLKPHTNIGDEPAYIVWIKGRTHVIPCLDAFGSYWKLDASASGVGSSGVDMTNKIGYRVDGQAAATGFADTLNIWAFANDANTEFAGFGYSEAPNSGFTGLTSGTRGSLCTITGIVTNARQFTIGASVVILRYLGKTFPHEWNWGTIVSIPSNTSLTVQLYPSLDIENTDITTGVGFVRQVDKFFPWNGRTDTSDQNDRIYKPNYRLVGQVVFNTGIVFQYSRKATQHWNKLATAFTVNPVVKTTVSHVIATTTTTRTPFARYLPLWTKDAILNMNILNTDFEVEVILKNIVGASSTNEWETIIAPTTTGFTDQTIEQIPITFNSNLKVDVDFTTAGAGTSASYTLQCVGYNDGGLQEL